MAHIRLLSLNTWGAPYAKHISARMDAITQHILTLSPDIVCLQEVFMSDSRDTLLKTLSVAYPHHHYFASGLIGSGLFTLSKFPILDANFLRFRLGGKPEKPLHGDYYAAKGIGLTHIKTPNGILDVYNIHPHAQYEHHEDNEYAAFTNSQLYETIRFVNSQSSQNTVVLCGDFNTQPHMLGYAVLTTGGQMVDAFSMLYPQDDGITFSRQNPYVTAPDQRLDYIFLKGAIAPDSVSICFTETFQNAEHLTYSDHYGLLTELTFTEQAISFTPSHNLKEVAKKLLKEVQREHDTTLAQRTHHIEQAVLGFASLVDIAFAKRIFLGRFPAFSRILGRISVIIACFYGTYHATNAFLNLRARLQVLSSLSQELQHQVQSRRWFDGRSL